MKFKIIPNEQTPKVIHKESSENILKNNYDLLVKFLKFAKKQKNCAGLASNQVSLDDDRIMLPFFALKDQHNRWDIYINPKITKKIGKKEIKFERCLTWIGKIIKANRYQAVEVEYCGLNGETRKEVINNFYAQAFQHEYNHIKGIKEIFKPVAYE